MKPTDSTPGWAASRSRRSRKKRAAAGAVRYFGLRYRNACGEHALGVEPGIDCAQRAETARHESRADEQYQRQRHLGDDEPVAQAMALPSARRAARTAFAQLCGQLTRREAKPGEEAEEERAAYRDHPGKRGHAPIDCRFRRGAGYPSVRDRVMHGRSAPQ